jgi:hypothetical protein
MVHGLETIARLNREEYERTIDAPAKPKRLTIAIDYDDTFTADPVTWSHVCQLLSLHHDVICVSARRKTAKNLDELRANLPTCVGVILLAYDRPKRLAARFSGFDVDIWIDDRPEGIATKEEMLAVVG